MNPLIKRLAHEASAPLEEMLQRLIRVAALIALATGCAIAASAFFTELAAAMSEPHRLASQSKERSRRRGDRAPPQQTAENIRRGRGVSAGRGIPTARGGQWSAVQVQLVVNRH